MELGGLVESQIRNAVYADQLQHRSGRAGDRTEQRVNAMESRSTMSCRPSLRAASPRRATCAC
jgi:hypothetical protein